MIIYYVLLLAIVLTNFMTTGMKKNKKRNIIVVISTISMILIQALRKYSVGTDLEGYISYFNMVKYGSVSSVKSVFYNLEWGYLYLTKFISFFTSDDQIFLAVLSLLILAPVGFFIARNSKMPTMSIILYISLGFYAFTFSGIRQALAIGLILISFQFVKNRKLIWFLICVVIASFIHQSALIFIPAYFLYNVRIKLKGILLISIILPFILIFKGKLIYIITLVFFPKYINSLTPTNAYTMLIVMILVFTVAYIFKKQVDEKNESGNVLYNYMLMAAILQIFAAESNIAMRMGYYYYIFIILLIPEVISVQKRQSLGMYLSTVVTILVLSFFQLGTPQSVLNIVPYLFFWQ